MKNYHHRFDIFEGKTFKILDLFTSYIEIKNEKENGKIIIDLSSIIEIIPVDGTIKDISMKYNYNGTEKVMRFSCDERGNLLSRVITMKDRSSKFISDYSIETFKCYNLLFILNSQTLKDIGQKLSEKIKGKSNEKPLNTENPLNKYIAFYTLYRTYSVVNQLNNKELKTYYIKLEKIIRIQFVPNIYGLVLEDSNKIRIPIIPINQKDVLVIKNMIISYAKKYLNYEIKYEETNDYLKDNDSIDLSLNKANSNYMTSDKKALTLSQQSSLQNKNNTLKVRHSEVSEEFMMSKKKYIGKNMEINKESKIQNYLFIYNNAYRIIYNENKQKIILKLASEYIEYVDYYLSESENTIISLSDIFIVAVNGEEDEYLEIISKTKSRFIFQIKEKILFLNDLIELLLKYCKSKKITEQFLVFSYKIGIEKNMRPIEDLSNRNIIEMRKIEQIIYEKDEDFTDIIEDIIVNRFFKGNSSELLLTDKISKILMQKFDYYYAKCINDKKDIKNNIILLNLLLILFKNLGMKLLLDEIGKKICENIFDKLTKEFEDRNFNNKRENNIILNDYGLFYNAIHIIEHFSLYKQFMLFKIVSFHNYEKKEINIIDYSSMYLNFLIILLEHKLVEFKEIPDVFLPQNEYFYILLTFYKIFIYEPIFVVRNAVLLLSTLIEKLIMKNQREFKEILLKKTMIFYALIRIYLINNNQDIILTKNCLRLFQTLLFQYYEMSIPIKNIFPPSLIKTIGGKKDPDKWEKIECEKFFKDIINDYGEEKIIWNTACKTELLDALNNLIEEYENSVNSKLLEINPAHKESMKNYYKDLINIILNVEKYDDLYRYPKKSIEYKPLFCIDYLNFKVEYETLKKEVYVLDTYISILVEKKGKIDIDRPAKFWKKLKKEFVVSNDIKRVTIIKAMIIIYQKYFEIIGNFDWYNMMNKIYKSTKSKNLKEQIKILLKTSIIINDDEIKENNVRDLMQENINYININ